MQCWNRVGDQWIPIRSFNFSYSALRGSNHFCRHSNTVVKFSHAVLAGLCSPFCPMLLEKTRWLNGIIEMESLNTKHKSSTADELRSGSQTLLCPILIQPGNQSKVQTGSFFFPSDYNDMVGIWGMLLWIHPSHCSWNLKKIKNSPFHSLGRV